MQPHFFHNPGIRSGRNNLIALLFLDKAFWILVLEAVSKYANIHYIGLSSAELAKERVARRVSEGGHGVSDSDVERCYEQSFMNLIKVIPISNLE